MPIRARHDLTGQVFGKLTVTGVSKASKGIGFLAPVTCTCGNRDTVFNHILLKGRKKACANCLTPKALPAAEGDFR